VQRAIDGGRSVHDPRRPAGSPEGGRGADAASTRGEAMSEIVGGGEGGESGGGERGGAEEAAEVGSVLFGSAASAAFPLEQFAAFATCVWNWKSSTSNVAQCKPSWVFGGSTSVLNC